MPYRTWNHPQPNGAAQAHAGRKEVTVMTNLDAYLPPEIRTQIEQQYYAKINT